MQSFFRVPMWICFALALPSVSHAADAVFSYQAQLRDAGQPADGAYDLIVGLYSSADGAGPEVASNVFFNTDVHDGLVTMPLAFDANLFASGARWWLQLCVRHAGDSGSCTPMLPRQEILEVPYAVTAGSVAPASIGAMNIQPGAVDTLQIAPGAVTNSRIAAGTISADRLAFVPGTVTAVVAGDGLVGGGTDGDITLAVDFTDLQRRIVDSCAPGESIRAITPAGTVVCEQGSSAVTTIRAQQTDHNAAAIVIGADGRALVASHGPGAGDAGLHFTYCSSADCSASESQVLDATLDPYSISMTLGPDGRPLIAYYDLDAQPLLKLSRCATATCATGLASTVTVKPIGIPSPPPRTAIVIGPDGMPLIALSATIGPNAIILLIHCTALDCSTRDPEQTIGGNEAVRATDEWSLAIGADGLPFFAFAHRASTAQYALYGVKCGSPDCSGAQTVTAIDTTQTDTGRDPNVTMRGSSPVISYFDRVNGDLRAAFCEDPTCAQATTFALVDSGLGDVVGANSAVVIDANEFPIIAYRAQTTNGVRIARCTDFTCSTGGVVATVDDQVGTRTVSGQISMALGTHGAPLLTFGMHDNNTPGANGRLRVVGCASAYCN